MNENAISEIANVAIKMLNEAEINNFSIHDPVISVKGGEIEIKCSGLLSTTAKLLAVEIHMCCELRPKNKPYRYNNARIEYIMQERRDAKLSIFETLNWTDDKFPTEFDIKLSKPIFDKINNIIQIAKIQLS